MKELTKGVPS